MHFFFSFSSSSSLAHHSALSGFEFKWPAQIWLDYYFVYSCKLLLFTSVKCVYLFTLSVCTQHTGNVCSLSLCTRLIDQISTSSAGRFLSFCVCVCLHLYVCYPAADLGRLLLLLLLSCVFSRCVFVYRWFDQTSERTRLHTLNFPCMYGSSLCWTHFRCFFAHSTFH